MLRDVNRINAGSLLQEHEKAHKFWLQIIRNTVYEKEFFCRLDTMTRVSCRHIQRINKTYKPLQYHQQHLYKSLCRALENFLE